MLVFTMNYSAWENFNPKCRKKTEFFISVKYLWLIHDFPSKKCGFSGDHVNIVNIPTFPCQN